MAISIGTPSGDTYWLVRGLSTDDKASVGSNIPNGSTFEEIDTGNKYRYDASTGGWYLQPASGGGGGTVTAGVASFNNRQGAVVPLAGDYTADMVGADPVGSAADALTDANAYTDNALLNFTVTTEFTQAVDTAVEEALQQNVSGADSGDIDALFP